MICLVSGSGLAFPGFGVFQHNKTKTYYALPGARIVEITLPYDTEVIGFLLHIFGYTEEAALELAILAKETEDCLR